MARFTRVRRGDERGASAVEYALVTVLIAVVMIVAVTLFGAKLSGLFQKTCSSIPDYTSSSTC